MSTLKCTVVKTLNLAPIPVLRMIQHSYGKLGKAIASRDDYPKGFGVDIVLLQSKLMIIVTDEERSNYQFGTFEHFRNRILVDSDVSRCWSKVDHQAEVRSTILRVTRRRRS